MSTQWADAALPRRASRPVRWGRIATVVVAALTSVGVAGGAADAASHPAPHGIVWNARPNASGIVWNATSKSSGIVWNASGIVWNTGIVWNSKPKASGIVWNSTPKASGIVWNARKNVVHVHHILVRR